MKQMCSQQMLKALIPVDCVCGSFELLSLFVAEWRILHMYLLPQTWWHDSLPSRRRCRNWRCGCKGESNVCNNSVLIIHVICCIMDVCQC